MMKLTYFGTAAYEAIPAIGCDCETCVRSRALGGKNIRLRTQAMVNDDLIIDFPEDAVWFSIKYNVNYTNVKSVIISHSHGDHLAPLSIPAFGTSFVKSNRTDKLNFYAGEDGYNIIEKALNDQARARVEAHKIEEFVTFKTGEYEITPLRANHDPNSTPFVFHIKKGDTVLLWCHDTGLLCEESIKVLSTLQKANCLSIDCTGALNGRSWRDGHLSYDTAIEFRNSLKSLGAIDDNTTVILNHFTHNGKFVHDEIEQMGKKDGMLIAYDGMSVEF